MQKSVYKSYDELPLFLNAELVGEVLSASSTTAYELFHQMLCEERKAYQCHLSFRTIGRSVGFSRNTVKKYVSTLEEKRLIFTEPTTVCTKDGRKRNGSLLYTIRPIEEAKEHYFDLQLQRTEEESAWHKTRKLLEQRRQERACKG